MKIDSPELEALRGLVRDLNVQWQMFDDLFSVSENFVLFNRTGVQFWEHFRSYLLDALFSSISRFFDPAANRQQANLSLAAVIEFPEVAPIKDELRKRLDQLAPIWESGIKIWRHKKLSHTDIATAMGTASLPNVPFAEMKELVIGITEFAREIDHRLNETDVGYHIHVHHWTPQLLKYLKAGAEKIDADEAEWRQKYEIPRQPNF